MTSSKDNKGVPDYEAMARDMMQQWQQSWKTAVSEAPATAAPMPDAPAAETAAAPDMMQAWQTMMQPMLATTQQFWQQVLTPAEPATAATAANMAPSTESAPDAAPYAAAAEPASQPVVQFAAPASAAPAAAASGAGADAVAELARRIDLLSQRLLRAEVELDKLKRGIQ